MIKATAKDGSTVFVRVSKSKARKLYDAGKPVTFCPVKLYPFGWFRPSCMMQKTNEVDDTFDYMVQNFEWYNCQWNETGYYAAFYVDADYAKH